MKELRKQVFDALYKYVEAYVEIKQEADKTGVINDDKMHLKQAEVNRTLNQKFDEAEERIKKPKTKGLFGGK